MLNLAMIGLLYQVRKKKINELPSCLHQTEEKLRSIYFTTSLFLNKVSLIFTSETRKSSRVEK